MGRPADVDLLCEIIESDDAGECTSFLTTSDLVDRQILDGRVRVAFSRDQPEKVYVQHRLWEHRAELLKWIDEGAHIYLCGDEKGVGRDVDAALARILADTAQGDDEAGRVKLKELAKAGRYQRDVY